MKLELETKNKKGVGNCKQCSTATTDSVVCFVAVGTRPIIMLVLFYLQKKKKKKVSLICVIYLFIIIISPHLGFLYISKQKNCIDFFFFCFISLGWGGKDFYDQQDLAVLLRPEPEGVALLFILFFKKR